MKYDVIHFVIITLCFSAFTFSTYAYEDTKGKPNVFIDYFWHPKNMSADEAEQLRNNVIQVINETYRVNLIDVDSNSALQIEKARRESGDIAGDDDLERMKVMEQQGANFLIQGRITSLVVEHKKADKHTALVNFTIKIINPNNGRLIGSKSFKAGGETKNFGLSHESASTPEEAVMKVCISAAEKTREFIENMFPLYGTIIEVEDAKNDAVKTLFVSVGSDVGVKVKDKFAVKIVRTVGGRKSLKEIGHIEIKAVEGGDISVAKVKDGGKEIKAAIDGGQTLVVESVPPQKRLISINI